MKKHNLYLPTEKKGDRLQRNASRSLLTFQRMRRFMISWQQLWVSHWCINYTLMSVFGNKHAVNVYYQVSYTSQKLEYGWNLVLNLALLFCVTYWMHEGIMTECTYVTNLTQCTYVTNLFLHLSTFMGHDLSSISYFTVRKLKPFFLNNACLPFHRIIYPHLSLWWKWLHIDDWISWRLEQNPSSYNLQTSCLLVVSKEYFQALG